jgi:hypothetical protein
MAKYMELVCQRHAESIQKARDSYFHGSALSNSAFPIDALKLEEYEVKAAGSIPNFLTELERKLMVTEASTPLFTADECQEVVSKAEEHFQGTGGWTTLPSGQYDVAGFWIRDVPAIYEWFNRMVQE